MKFMLIMCLVVLAQTLTDEEKEKFKKYRTDCLLETNVEVNLINNLKTGYFKVDNKVLFRFLHCMLVKSEQLSKNGQLKKNADMTKVRNTAGWPQIEKIVDLYTAMGIPFFRTWPLKHHNSTM